MHVPSFIERKRDGGEHEFDELQEFLGGYVSGRIPDYQVSAWAMAVYLRGMSARETSALTRAMLETGDVFSYPPGTPPRVDKHSTGGIGDKVSLVLAPLLACDELWVPMIAGRGLGITGGTLDKLESIPGYRVSLSRDEALAQLEKLGVCIMGQTADICPADRRLYALRDVTGTVQSQPLIVASIMSKKLAETLDRLVLDVKWGRGAFMKSRRDAEALANALVAVGQEMGVEMHHLLTPMDEPLGREVGNALEVAEAVDTLQGRGPEDLETLTLDLAERVAKVSRAKLQEWLQDGTAWRKFVALVEAQGGDARTLETLRDLQAAPIMEEITAEASGMLEAMDAGEIGRGCVLLGAGRTQSTDAIDPRVGCTLLRKKGSPVQKGEPLIRVHAADTSRLHAALPFFRGAISIEH